MADTMDPTSSLVDPFGPDALAIQRKRQIAATMMQQMLAPRPQGQMVGNVYAPASPLSALVPVLAAIMSGKLNDQADKSQQTLSQDFYNRQNSAFNGYTGGGAPGAPGATPPETPLQIPPQPQQPPSIGLSPPVSAGGTLPAMPLPPAGAGPAGVAGPPAASTPMPGAMPPPQPQMPPPAAGAGSPMITGTTGAPTGYMESLKRLGPMLIGQYGPAMQKFAQGEAERIQKGAITPQGLVANPELDPISALAAVTSGMDLSKIRPANKTVVAGDSVYSGNPYSGGYHFDAGAKYGPVEPVAQTPMGPIMGQTDAQTGKTTFAPPGTNVNVNTAQTSADSVAKTLGDAAAQRVITSQGEAEKGVTLLRNLQSATEALHGGVYSGSGADTKLLIAKFGKLFGLPGSDDPKIANSEQYRMAVGQQLLGMTKALGSGSGFSDNDLKFLGQALGTSQSLDDATMARALKMTQAGAASAVFNHERNLANLRGVPGASDAVLNSLRVPFNFSLPKDLKMGADGRIQIPDFTAGPEATTTAPAAPGTVSYDEFVK